MHEHVFMSNKDLSLETYAMLTRFPMQCNSIIPVQGSGICPITHDYILGLPHSKCVNRNGPEQKQQQTHSGLVVVSDI
jgi:hypothetical protein